MTLATRFRSRFALPAGTIYLDGNSLGALSDSAEAAVLQALTSWREWAVQGWTEGERPWLTVAEEVGALLAPLVGAAPESVIATGSTTTNLHQLLATLDTGRGKLLADALAFPSDRYALQSYLRLRGRTSATDLVLVPSSDGATLDEAAICAAFATGTVALAVLPSVVYTSGQLLDIPRLAAAAQQAGVILILDLAHSVGILPHDLETLGVDAAFWCTYKWLNGGPGAVGGLYLHPRWHHRRAGMEGWWGAAKTALFANCDELIPADGAARLQVGTPHILSLAAVRGALELIAEAGIAAIRAESLTLTQALREHAERELIPLGVTIATPVEPTRRGGHLALRHPDARLLSLALRRAGIVPDHRGPDWIRLAPSPLYNTPAEGAVAIAHLRRCLETDAHRVGATDVLVP